MTTWLKNPLRLVKLLGSYDATMEGFPRNMTNLNGFFNHVVIYHDSEEGIKHLLKDKLSNNEIVGANSVKKLSDLGMSSTVSFRVVGFWTD
jgi:hypothetical protein